MNVFIASVISSVDEKTFLLNDKKLDLNEHPEYAPSQNTSPEHLSAEYSHRKFVIRPVVLVSCFSGELLHGFPNKEIEKTFFHDKTIHQVTLAPVSYAELNTALKESLRLEKTIIKNIDYNIPILSSTAYVTIDTSSFFISQNRLLGEILKAQRKLEKHKAHGTLYTQKSLEAFLKKLCTFYVLSMDVPKS
ncbi:hypothetical protein NEFER03_0279 [Nematocida sp. LUAm3]|nr:hypothetical protein NEFER03_0279 [Nematocida sp. LUAm3]KAI5176954.1 hypothetical protein NEFER01_0279 [Nematocida sp. LUAm1]